MEEASHAIMTYMTTCFQAEGKRMVPDREGEEGEGIYSSREGMNPHRHQKRCGMASQPPMWGRRQNGQAWQRDSSLCGSCFASILMSSQPNDWHLISSSKEEKAEKEGNIKEWHHFSRKNQTLTAVPAHWRPMVFAEAGVTHHHPSLPSLNCLSRQWQ